MAKFTTGEIARQCGVSVRTVQYYDSRGLLVPSELSEGGRRLYSEEDRDRMKIICFLRELDLPIQTIAQLFEEGHSEKVANLFLEQQKIQLRQEIEKRQAQLDKLEELQQNVKSMDCFSIESIGDIAYIMENKEKIKKIHRIMLCVGIPLEMVEWVTLIYAGCTGHWGPYLCGLGLLILGTIWLCRYYYRKVAFICPRCHLHFRTSFWKMIFAKHTLYTRKLRCRHCGYEGLCVETHRKEEE